MAVVIYFIVVALGLTGLAILVAVFGGLSVRASLLMFASIACGVLGL